MKDVTEIFSYIEEICSATRSDPPGQAAQCAPRVAVTLRAGLSTNWREGYRTPDNAMLRDLARIPGTNKITFELATLGLGIEAVACPSTRLLRIFFVSF
jgi:hypothetical protein